MPRLAKPVVAVAMVVALGAQPIGAANLAFMARPGAMAAMPPAFHPASRAGLARAAQARPAPRPGPLSRLGAWTWANVTGLSNRLADIIGALAAGTAGAAAGTLVLGPAAPDALHMPLPARILPEPGFGQPAPGRPADRMLIAAGDMPIISFGAEAREWLSALSADRSHKPIADVLRGPWRESNGLRYRINYIKPEGYLRLAGGIAQVIYPGRPAEFLGSHSLDRRYWRDYGVYHGGDTVAYEVELENATGSDLRDLSVTTRQESFNREGGKGRVIGAYETGIVESLPAGGRATVRQAMVLSGERGAERWNLEQTRLTVSAGRGEGRELIDDGQAGVVDPPAD